MSAKDFYYKDLTKEKEVTKILSMVKILRKIFIKNYEDVQNEKVREKHGVLASLVGIVFNTLLFLMKLIINLPAKKPIKNILMVMKELNILQE